MIDWVLGCIIFHQPSQHNSKMSPSVETMLSAPLASPQDPVVPNVPMRTPTVEPKKPPQVTIINAAVYSCACKLKGSQCFQLKISLPKVIGRSMTVPEILVDLSQLPKEYHDFTDMSSKTKASKLAEH